MAKIDDDAQKVMEAWMDFLIPQDISPKELRDLAKKSRLSSEALRKLKGRHRKGMTTDTFIRLAIGRGMPASSLISMVLKGPKKSNLDSSEVAWINYGAGLTTKKRNEFLDFIKYIRKTWKV